MSDEPSTATPGEALPAERLQDRVLRNPSIHFFISEFWAGVTGTAVYTIFVACSYFVRVVNVRFPLLNAAPAELLDQTLSWGGALSGSATFVVITIYQLLVLIKRLRKDYKNV